MGRKKEDTEMLKVCVFSYARAVEQYLEIENVLDECYTEADFRGCAEKANLFLDGDFMKKYSRAELRNIILAEYRMQLKAITFTFLDKFEIKFDSFVDDDPDVPYLDE